MEMKMKMKDNKMLLALTLVAALALCSVAAVAVSEDVDADSTVYFNQSATPIVYDGVSSADIYVYSTEKDAANVEIQIKKDAKFTGSINFVTVKQVDAADPSKNFVYDKIYNTITLDGVSDVTIIVKGDSNAESVDPEKSTTVIYGSTTGSIELTKGSVTLGVTGEEKTTDGKTEPKIVSAFNGAVKVNGTTFDSKNTAGAILTLGKSGSKTTAYLEGTIVGDTETVFADEPGLPTLNVTGPFTINQKGVGPTTISYAALIIPEGTTATISEDTELQNDGVLIVNGKLTVETTKKEVDSIDNNGLLYVNGTIEYVTVGTIAVSPIDDGFINAYYYMVSDKVNGTNTHYYTTFANADAASDDITVYGVHLVSEDMSLSGKFTFGDKGHMTFMIIGMPDLKIDISGILADVVPSEYMDLVNEMLGYLKLSMTVVSPSYSTVTVGPDAEVTIVDKSLIVVLNGKLSVDIDGSVDGAEEGIIASVKGMSEGDNTIYTTLETALGLAKSGDVITLSYYGYIFKDATLPAGVTLASDANAEHADGMMVYCGAKFTVNGIIDESVGSLWILPSVKASAVINDKTVSVSLDAAEVIINGGAKVTLKYILLGGFLTIASDFDNITSTSKDFFTVGEIDVLSKVIIDEKSSGIINDESGKLIAGLGEMISDINVSIDSATLNVNGKLNLGNAHFKTNDDINGLIINEEQYNSKVTVNVAGTLKSASVGSESADKGAVYSIMNVTGSFVSTGAVSVTVMNVTGTGSVTEFNDKSKISVAVLTSGVAGNTFGVNSNETVVKITGTVDYAIVYGTPADKAISFNAAKSTQFYIKDKILYATEYSTSDKQLKYLSPTVTGYILDGWFTEDGKQVSKSNMTLSNIGATSADGVIDDELYAKFSIQTFSVTFTPVTGAGILLGGNPVDGTTSVDYNAVGYTLALLAEKGYDISNAKILVNEKELTGNYVPQAGDKITVTGVTEKVVEEDSGMGITEILLIVITIMVVVMAIIIALKLMRS